MNWQEFTALLVLATAMSFSPGPNTTLSTALAANGGLPRAMRFVWAVPVGWSLLLALCAAGIGALVVAAPSLRWVIKAFGIAYLLWLAWKLSASSQALMLRNCKPTPCQKPTFRGTPFAEASVPLPESFQARNSR